VKSNSSPQLAATDRNQYANQPDVLFVADGRGDMLCTSRLVSSKESRDEQRREDDGEHGIVRWRPLCDGLAGDAPRSDASRAVVVYCCQRQSHCEWRQCPHVPCGCWVCNRTSHTPSPCCGDAVECWFCSGFGLFQHRSAERAALADPLNSRPRTATK